MAPKLNSSPVLSDNNRVTPFPCPLKLKKLPAGSVRMADFSSLKAGLSGAVIFKSENSKTFQKEIEGTWNAVIRTRQPCAFVRVASVEDVVNTVKLCVHNKVSHAIQKT